MEVTLVGLSSRLRYHQGNTCTFHWQVTCTPSVPPSAHKPAHYIQVAGRITWEGCNPPRQA